MLKKYLLSCNSKEYFNNRRVQASLHKSKEQTQTETCQETTNIIPAVRHNIRQGQNNYFTGIRLKQNQQILKIQSTDKKVIPQLQDLEETKKQDVKLKSISNSSHRNIRTTDERCKSHEKIKVFDIFNQTPRHASRENINGPKVQGFKEKIVYSSQSKNTQQQKQLPSFKQGAFSSRANDSAEIIQKLQRKQNSSDDRQNLPIQSFFQQPLIRQSRDQSQLKLDLEKVRNDHILELLLLTTGELKDKFKQERNASEERQQRSAIRVIASDKFPKDFFRS
ncbi:hypothetical protein pb186bvf_015380 [Paramecium bursaria]